MPVAPGPVASRPVGVTIAVPTYHRPDDLQALLPLLLDQARLAEARGHPTTVLVVDNDPAASARAVVEAVGRGAVRYVVEPEPGISAVRNRAMEEGGGGLLAYIDDDERPNETWLPDLLEVWDTTRAAAVLLDADTCEVLDQQVARLPTRMPYIPGLLSFRELPALLEALAMLKAAPDLAFIDGHGIAHPRRLGIAAHFGVATGLPSIGVAKKILTGEARMALHDMRGAFTPLRSGKEQIGWLLRSKPGCLPLVVSPGHRISMAAAPELVMRYVGKYRLPEPTRLADRIASRRDHDRE